MVGRVRGRLRPIPTALPGTETSGGTRMNLEGKTAVITGASRGIGAALARMLHERGVNLGLASRSGGDLGLEGVYAASCDVRDYGAVERFCDATAERFGAVDIVVANAGDGATASGPGGVPAEFAMEPGRGVKAGDPVGMRPEDVADVVVFVLERPHRLRILETAFRVMTERSWG